MKEELSKNGIPTNWKWEKLGKACEVITGTTPPKSDSTNYGSDIPFFKPPHLWDGIIDDTDERLSLRGSKKARVVPPNTVLVTCIGNLGRTGFVKKEAAFNQQINAILENENISGKYIFYQAQSPLFKKQLEKLATGTTVSIVNKGNFETIGIPIPPREEQQQIVSKIEELFSELDKGIEELQTAQQQLNIYRKTILMNGAVGKLTEEWRNKNPNTKSSETIFQEIQNLLDHSFKKATDQAAAAGKRKPKDQRKNKKTFKDESNLPVLPKNWNYYRLEDITYLVTDGTHFTPKYQESGVKFLSVKNVRPFYFREENLKYISKEEHQSLIERCNPQKNDILYTKVGATYGYAAKVTMDYEFSIFVSLCLIKPVYEYFSSDFLEILMNSELVFQQARKRVSGSGVPDLHLIEIRDFKIPLPSFEEQQQIVQEVQSRLSVYDNIEETITNSLKQAEALRQSILKKAFEGNLLTNQNSV